jgi:hypothetical protein
MLSVLQRAPFNESLEPNRWPTCATRDHLTTDHRPRAHPVNVSYENTLEDMVALAEHQLSTNAAYHKRRLWNLYGSPLLLLGLFAYIAHITQKPAFLVGGMIGALFSFLWSRRGYRHFPRKAVERLHREKPQKEVFCRHTITVSPEGFTEETAESRHFHRWTALYDIAFTPGYIFVYNTPATAHIVPRREIGDEQFEQLINEIRKSRNA